VVYVLYGVFDNSGRRASHRIVALALKNVPAIVVDTNCTANPHKFENDIADFSQVYVVEAESLYRFAPTLNMLDAFAQKLNVHRIFVTAFTHLFGYDDVEENRDVFENCWKKLHELSLKYDVYVAILTGSIHHKISTKYGLVEVDEMGHTVASQRIITDTVIGELAGFAKALRQEDQERYLRMIKQPLKHLGEISYTSSAQTWAVMLLCIMLEQEKRIEKLEGSIIKSVQ
jgi:rRNA-processing protein FCF1